MLCLTLYLTIFPPRQCRYFFLTISSWQQSCSFSQTFHNFTKHILQVALVDAYVSTCCGVAVFHKISSQALHCYLFQPVLLPNLMVHDAALAGFLGSVCIAKCKAKKRSRRKGNEIRRSLPWASASF